MRDLPSISISSSTINEDVERSVANSPGVAAAVSGRRASSAESDTLAEAAKMETSLNFDAYRVVSFDCYGTLIDWEPGIIRLLRPILAKRGLVLSDEEILEAFGRFESAATTDGYLPYREVLLRIVDGLGESCGFVPETRERQCLVDAWQTFTPFVDTRRALAALASKYALAVISNIDDELFQLSAATLETRFDWVITAQQTRTYKPGATMFEYALAQFGVRPDEVLHVAQSLHHDIEPCRRMGFTTVRIHRRHDKRGFGVSPISHAQPDINLPDLDTLVRLSVTR